MAAPLNLNTLTFPQSAVRTSGLQPHDNIDDKLDTIIASTGAIADVKTTTNTIATNLNIINSNVGTVDGVVDGLATLGAAMDAKLDTLVTNVATIKTDTDTIKTDVADIKAATVTP